LVPPQGEDQDLDDHVIRQLRDENENLKYELSMLREASNDDNSANAEMSAILRDRINDLLVANGDLEKQVVKLNVRVNDHVNHDDLIETKESLNIVSHENDQLRLAISKERYGPRSVPIEAKQQLNILQTENEELKTEVRKFRYGVHHSLLFEDDDDDQEPDDNDNAGYNSTDVEYDILEDLSSSKTAESEDNNEEMPNFVTLSRLQAKPVLPAVILMGGKINSNKDKDNNNIIDDDDDTNEDDEGFVEDVIDDNEEMEIPIPTANKKETKEDVFKSFRYVLIVKGCVIYNRKLRDCSDTISFDY
jgi:hypothetical protein